MPAVFRAGRISSARVLVDKPCERPADFELREFWERWGDTEITPTEWIEAWQHVTSVISSIAPNATWVWAPNIEPGGASVAPY